PNAFLGYNSTRDIVKAIVILLVVEAAFDVSNRAIDLTHPTGILAYASLGLNVVGGLAGLANFILLMIWIYWSNNNLTTLGATELEFKPKWTIIWWFIPIANFWKPYYALQEIMKASDPSVGRTDLQARRNMTRPQLVLNFWLSLWASGGGVGVHSLLDAFAPQ